ncbi:MAG: hypothetical protein ACPKPY_11920 [Nitrososphaeraceae archaeon]
MLQELARNIIDIKKEFNRTLKTSSIISEIIPDSEKWFNVEYKTIKQLHNFAENNPIYQKKEKIKIKETEYLLYQGDITEYYLSAKKYDTNYQPFYPTWLITSLVLCLNSRELGFNEIIDIGSGDGRIPYCGTILNMKSTSIELDKELVELQKKICFRTNTNFDIINTDASTYNLDEINVSKPTILISGLPEMGEMFVHHLNKTIRNSKFKKTCVVFIGSDTKRKYKDNTEFGWGEIIRKSQLKVIDRLTLPTHWTNYQDSNTTYIFTKYE